MIDKLEAIKAKFDQLGIALTNPEIVNDNKKFTATSREYRSLEKIVQAYDDYRKVLDNIEFNTEVLNGDDEEMRDLAKHEFPELEEKKTKMEADIRQMLIPKDPQDEKNAILEIRAGTGGQGHCRCSRIQSLFLRVYRQSARTEKANQPRTRNSASHPQRGSARPGNQGAGHKHLQSEGVL